MRLVDLAIRRLFQQMLNRRYDLPPNGLAGEVYSGMHSEQAGRSPLFRMQVWHLSLTMPFVVI